MAIIYLRSTDGSDSDDGSTWALAKATLAAALTAAGAGGTVYVSQAHAETQATAMTLVSPGTAASLVRVCCVSDSSEPPTTMTTGATVSTTGASSIIFTGFAYVYGVSFQAGSGTSLAPITFGSSNNAWSWRLDTCSLKLQGSNAGSKIFAGVLNLRDSLLHLINTTITFPSSSSGIVCPTNLVWQDTASALDGTIPTTLFIPTTSSSGMANVTVRGVDLSALTSGDYLVTPAALPGSYRFVNCKLGSSVSAINGSIPGQGGAVVTIDNCDSSDTNYRMEHYKYQGSIKTETSKIRSGGASDGTTPISWNMTTLAGSSFVSPLESPPISIWNETTGSSKTVTVEIAQDSAATALNDDEIWIEVEYLGTSGYPMTSIASDRKANMLSSAAAQTTSGATWSNMTTPTKQQLSVTFTPQEKGLFAARVMLAKSSTTVYVDPLITVS